mmetsp:Transcript_118291/g.166287  ORF Transcript_118291/g.166287 Transcript_118291/m.166287 type:complete len:641 (-) Transcript_118291:267-2189(-)
MLRVLEVGVQHPHAADQHGHLRRGQGEELGPVDQDLLGRHGVLAAHVVHEPVGRRLQHIEAIGVGLLGRRVGPTRGERHLEVDAAVLGGLLDRGTTRQHDDVGQRDLLVAGLSRVELAPDLLERVQHRGELLRLAPRPILHRVQTDARTVGAAPLVRAPEGRGRGPGGVDQLVRRDAGGQDGLLERRDVVGVHELMVDRRNRILPDQVLGRHFLAEVARLRTHVAVGQLEPSTREGIGELVGVLVEASRDLLVVRIHAHRHVGGGHDDRNLLRAVVRRRRHVGVGLLLRGPLIGAGGALGQLPLVAEQHVEVVVVPLGRRGGPGSLDAAGDGVVAATALEGAEPAETLRLDVATLGLRTDMRGVARAVALAEGVTAGGQRHGLLVVHRHSGEGLADVLGRGQRIRIAVRTLGVHVDQAHLHRGQRVLEVAVTGIAALRLVAGRKPLGLLAPVDVLLGLVDVGAAATESEGLEAHVLERRVAGQDQQVGPGDLVAVLLLDRPQQAPGLVQVAVVGPAVQRSEALRAGAAAAAAVLDAVGAGSVPRHPNEQRAVVPVISRPPLLGVRHQIVEVLLEGIQIQLLELLGVVEARAHRVGQAGVLMQHLQVQLVGPPILVRGALRHALRMHHRALADSAIISSVH